MTGLLTVGNLQKQPFGWRVLFIRCNMVSVLYTTSYSAVIERYHVLGELEYTWKPIQTPRLTK